MDTATAGDRDHAATAFGAASTAAEVIAGVDLTGKQAIVTGASSGIGLATARALASAHATVTLAVRDLAAGQRAAAEIARATGSPAVRAVPLDLADRQSIATFVSAWRGPLHLLIANAAVMAVPGRMLTASGWESHLAVNHLGHFELALGLHSALAAAGGARIVSVSSRGHLRSPVVFDDLNFVSRRYEPAVAYGQSKTANILFAVEANRRWAADSVTANAVHPGAVADTNITRYLDAQVVARLRAADQSRFKSVEQGAATSVLVATAPSLEGVGGRYFEDCAQAPCVPGGTADLSCGGVAAYAVDQANACRLWEMSEYLLSRARHR